MATCTQWFELMPKQAKQQQHGIRKVEITDLMEETSPQNEEMRWREAKQYHLTTNNYKQNWYLKLDK